MLYQLSQLAKSDWYARCLNDVVQSFDDAASGARKVHWMQQFTQFNFESSSTVDVWGCEQDMFVPCLATVTTSIYIKNNLQLKGLPQANTGIKPK